jgi:hypothetical protein
MIDYSEVEEAVKTAKAIAWDTCHKIYVLMDEQQVEQMRVYGYDPLITADEMTPSQMLDTIVEWFEDSCGLRFVEAVSTSTGYESLIPQGANWEDEDDTEDEEAEEDE